MLSSLLSFSMIPLISFSFYQVVLLFRVLLIALFFISALSLPQFLPKHFLKTFYFVHVIPSVRTKFSAHVLPSAHIRPTAHVPSSAHIKLSVHFSLTLPITNNLYHFFFSSSYLPLYVVYMVLILHTILISITLLIHVQPTVHIHVKPTAHIHVKSPVRINAQLPVHFHVSPTVHTPVKPISFILTPYIMLNQYL